MRLRRALLLPLGLSALLAPAASAQDGATPTYPSAVVLVSGYNSSSAFTSPDPACAGQEGDTWSNPAGPAAALRAAGANVFTAPVQHGTDPALPPCTSAGAAVPPTTTYVNSYGDLDDGGAALAGFLAFLRDSYGVQRVQLVAHSNGGNWSRGALTQNAAYSGLQIESLTTLGTPYIGSFAADIAVELNNGKCDFSNEVEQGICDVILDLIQAEFAGSGPTTIKQLTHAYMETWNDDQRIGSCPVTTIAGTYLSIPLVPFTYYSPSDGVVGEASGLAHSAYDISLELIPAPDIAGLRSGGTFPVVHSPALSFLSDDNLLNQPAISEAVVEAAGDVPLGGPLCTPAATSANPPAATVRAPLRELVPPSRSGRLPAAGPEDALVTTAGTDVRCGVGDLPLTPLLGDERLRLATPGTCNRRLRVGDGEAILLRRTRGDVLVRHDGDEVRVRVRGRRLETEDARVSAIADGERTRLELDGKGNADLPDADRHVLLRTHVPLGRGDAARATAVLSPRP